MANLRILLAFVVLGQVVVVTVDLEMLDEAFVVPLPSGDKLVDIF